MESLLNGPEGARRLIYNNLIPLILEKFEQKFREFGNFLARRVD
jgi:hypothetical protein